MLAIFFAFGLFILGGIFIQPRSAIYAWDLGNGQPQAESIGAVAAAENSARLNPAMRRIVVSYSEGKTSDWPEPYAGDCGPAIWVTVRTLYGLPMASGLVHCTGKQVIWT